MQLAIPRVGAARVRNQLIRGGGTAEVGIQSFPATRLLHNAGERIVVRGEGLEIGLGGGDPLAGATGGLNALDGFRDVDIELVSFRAGPFWVSAFVLERSGGGTYALAAQARASAADIARLGAARLAQVPGRGLLGSLPIPAAISSQGGARFGRGGARELGRWPQGSLRRRHRSRLSGRPDRGRNRRRGCEEARDSALNPLAVPNQD